MSTLRSFPLAAVVAVGPHWDGQPASDLFAACGTPVLAVEDGYADSYWVPLGGNAATLTFADGSGAAYYAHMSAPAASGWIGVGSVLGAVGETGNAAGKGCHLHFAVASSAAIFDQRNGAGDVDPAAYLAGAGLGSPSDGAGGGGVDPGQGGGAAKLWLLAGAALALLVLTSD